MNSIPRIVHKIESFLAVQLTRTPQKQNYRLVNNSLNIRMQKDLRNDCITRLQCQSVARTASNFYSRIRNSRARFNCASSPQFLSDWPAVTQR